MKAMARMVGRGAFVLAVLCTGWLVFDMVAIPIYKEQVFLQRGTIAPGGEIVIALGFLLLPLFNALSLLWVSLRVRKAGVAGPGDLGILALGALCLILLIGEKAMADEIGREYLLGWEVVGEWIILYAFLAIQLFYNVLILRRLYRARGGQRAEARP